MRVPKPGDTFTLGGATVEVIGPVKQYDNTNDTSIVLRIAYGDTSFLFTGDMEWDSEHDILDAGYDVSADVLKIAHHGSDTSTSYVFLRDVMPKYAVVSVGKGNPYGHPTEAVLSSLRDADVTVYRTDLRGDIVFTSDGSTITVETQKQPSIKTNPTAIESGYIGNVKSKKFHRITCQSLPAEKNRVALHSRVDAIEGGYTPCGNCKP